MRFFVLLVLMTISGISMADVSGRRALRLLPNDAGKCSLEDTYDQAKMIKPEFICKGEYKIVEIYSCISDEDEKTQYLVLGSWINTADYIGASCAPEPDFFEIIKK